jgi:hypothetical protein
MLVGLSIGFGEVGGDGVGTRDGGSSGFGEVGGDWVGTRDGGSSTTRLASIDFWRNLLASVGVKVARILYARAKGNSILTFTVSGTPRSSKVQYSQDPLIPFGSSTVAHWIRTKSSGLKGVLTRILSLCNASGKDNINSACFASRTIFASTERGEYRRRS